MNVMDATPKTMLQIPPFYDTKLKEKPELVGPLYTTIHNFEAWVSDCHFEFFPEYTDHRIEHLQYVLASVFELIHEITMDKITSEDVCALTLAVLLHDAGMYFSADNVRGLLLSTDRDYYAGLSKNEKWKQRWEGYIEEAKHWDSAQRQQVLGDLEETFSLRSFNLENKDLRDSDKRFIGEFLRRNHPDLAYTIAMYGLPHENKEEQQLIDANITEKMRKIGAMVALSHGYDLRKAIELVEESFPGNNVEKSHAKVHITFLMVLLRIADYLHIHADRAKSVFAWNFCNSNSELEQKLHTAISAVEVEVEGCDPECINVDCDPTELDVILGLQDRFTGLQRELDQCWAVLGGVYKANGYKLRYRRISTSIDDLEEYTTKEELKFIPKRFHLGVAQAEIIKLLIRPLYGDEPKYGIRELLQNAVDAVLERKAYEENHKERSHYTEYEIEGEVEIALIKHATKGKDHPRTTVQVTDKGIGMTEEVIQHYFLTAGASFRNSLAWKKEFEVVDAQGAKSRVCRSGRFGIGAFAAFLLGDKITVTTRHITSEVGYHFIVGQNDELIQVDKVWEAPVGTKIEVEIGEGVYNVLNGNTDAWDWFCLDKPRVIRNTIDYNKQATQTQLPQKIIIPTGNRMKAEIEQGNWRGVDVEGLGGVYYSIFPEHSVVAINGINNEKSTTFNPYGHPVSLLSPENRATVFIVDADGRIPLRIQRDSFYMMRDNEYIYDKFIYDMEAVILSALLAIPYENIFLYNKINLTPLARPLSILHTSRGFLPCISLFGLEKHFYRNVDSFTEISQTIFDKMKHLIVCFYPSVKRENKLLHPELFEDELYRMKYYKIPEQKPKRMEMPFSLAFDLSPDMFLDTNLLTAYPIIHGLPLNTLGFEGYIHSDTICQKDLKEFFKLEEVGNGLVSFSYGKPVPVKNIDRFKPLIESGASLVFISLSPFIKNRQRIRFCKVWSDMIGKRPIPYDEKEREKLFPRVFEQYGSIINQFRERFKNAKPEDEFGALRVKLY